MEQFKNKPLKGPVKHPITGEYVKACQALIHRFTPTGIWPTRRERRLTNKNGFKINNRKRTPGRVRTYQEVVLALSTLTPEVLAMSAKEMKKKGIALWRKYVDRLTWKYRTKMIRHYPEVKPHLG